MRLRLTINSEVRDCLEPESFVLLYFIVLLGFVFLSAKGVEGFFQRVFGPLREIHFFRLFKNIEIIVTPKL